MIDHSSCKKKTPIVQKTAYKVGDWVYFEFNLNQIIRMEGQYVREVSDGMTTTASGGEGMIDRCMPLELPVKRISWSFERYYDQIRDEALSDLNFPDIHDHLVDMWIDICNWRNDEKTVSEKFEAVGDFVDEVIRKCKEVRRIEVGGDKDIRLIRPKSRS